MAPHKQGARRIVGWLETRKVPVLFAVATLLPIAALCWLGVRTLEQDRDLERQRRRERLEVAADRVAIDIEQDLQRIEAKLADGDGIRFLPAQIVARRDEPLLFRPDVPSVSLLWSGQLAAAAQQEDRSPSAAIRTYERIAAATTDPDRGEALVALGALLRRQRRFDQALPTQSQPSALRAGASCSSTSAYRAMARFACASCHDPERAFSDGRPVAIGVFDRVGKRNAPALVNRGYDREPGSRCRAAPAAAIRSGDSSARDVSPIAQRVVLTALACAR